MKSIDLCKYSAGEYRLKVLAFCYKLTIAVNCRYNINNILFLAFSSLHNS